MSRKTKILVSLIVATILGIVVTILSEYFDPQLLGLFLILEVAAYSSVILWFLADQKDNKERKEWEEKQKEEEKKE